MPADLRPLSLGELLDRSFFLYRKHFLLFAGITALPHLVLLAFQLVGIEVQRLIGTSFLWVVATWAVTLGVTAASQGATVIAVSHVHLERPTSIAESFAGIKGRMLYLAWIMFAYWFIIVIGLFLLIVPGIILWLMWALTVPVAAIENTGLLDSLNRSAELTKGGRGRVFVVYILFMVLLWAIYMAWMFPVMLVIGLAARGHQVGGFPLWTQIAMPVGSFFSQCLAGPLMTIGLSLLYYDQRVRKEAFDLQHMMATLDGTPFAGAAPAVSV